MMPGQDGVSFTAELRARIDLPVLLLTARGEIEDRVNGLAVGADDYLVKPFDPRELLLRIATILRRAAPAAPERWPLRFGALTYDPERQELRRGDHPVHLTDAELSLLQILAEQPGLAVSRYQLGERSRISGSERAVDTQIARLRRKLEPEPREPRYLLTKRGEGYVLRPGAYAAGGGARRGLAAPALAPQALAAQAFAAPIVAAHPVRPLPSDRGPAAADPAGHPGLRFLRAPLGHGDPLAGGRPRRRGGPGRRPPRLGRDHRRRAARCSSSRASISASRSRSSPAARWRRRWRRPGSPRAEPARSHPDRDLRGRARPAVRDRHPHVRLAQADRRLRADGRRAAAGAGAAHAGRQRHHPGLHGLDGRAVAAAADRVDLLPDPAAAADPAPRLGRRQLRQGPRRRRLQARGRVRDPQGWRGVQPDAQAHPAPHQPAHRHAGRGLARPAHAAHPHEARAGDARRRAAAAWRPRGPAQRRRGDGGRGRRLSRLRPRRGPRRHRPGRPRLRCCARSPSASAAIAPASRSSSSSRSPQGCARSPCGAACRT